MCAPVSAMILGLYQFQLVDLLADFNLQYIYTTRTHYHNYDFVKSSDVKRIIEF